MSRDASTAEFSFINRGLSPLTIELLEPGCACLDADATNGTVLPADESQIVVRVRADDPGDKSTFVMVHSNDQERPRVRLDVKWRGVAPIEFEPPSVDFGSVPPNSGRERTVRLRRRADLDTDANAGVLEWDCVPHNALTISVPDDADPDAITIGLRTDGEKGERRAMVRALFDGGATKELTLPVTWAVRDVIEVTPARLSLGFGRPGEVREFTLVVSSFADEPLSIVSVAFDPAFAEWAQASLEARSESVTLVRVRARLPDESGAHVGELILECTSPEARSIRVPVSAYVNMPAPETQTDDRSVPVCRSQSHVETTARAGRSFAFDPLAWRTERCCAQRSLLPVL